MSNKVTKKVELCKLPEDHYNYVQHFVYAGQDIYQCYNCGKIIQVG